MHMISLVCYGAPPDKHYKYPSGYSSAGVGEAERNSRHDWQSRLCEPSDRNTRSHRRHSRRFGFIALRDGLEWPLTARAILSSHLQVKILCYPTCACSPALCMAKHVSFASPGESKGRTSQTWPNLYVSYGSKARWCALCLIRC